MPRIGNSRRRLHDVFKDDCQQQGRLTVPYSRPKRGVFELIEDLFLDFDRESDEALRFGVDWCRVNQTFSFDQVSDKSWTRRRVQACGSGGHAAAAVCPKPLQQARSWLFNRKLRGGRFFSVFPFPGQLGGMVGSDGTAIFWWSPFILKSSRGRIVTAV